MKENPIFPKISALRNNWSQIDQFAFLIFQELNDVSDKKFQADVYFKENQNSKLYINLEIFKKLRDKRFYYHNKSRIDFLLAMPYDSFTWLKFTSEIIKIHYQFGKEVEIPLIGPWKPYISLTTTRKITNSSLKLGLFKHINNASIDLRYRYNVGESQPTNFFYSKISYNSHLFFLSNVNCFGLSNKLLQKNDIFLSIKPLSNHSLGLKLENNEFRNHKINYKRIGSYFDSMKLMYLFNNNEVKAGLLYEYSIEQSQSKKMEILMKFNSLNVKMNTLLELGLQSYFRWRQFDVEIGAKWKNVKRNKLPSIINFKMSYQ